MHTDFVCVRPEMPLREAIEIMLQEDTLLLPVIHDECGRHGVLMEVDVLRVILPSYLDNVASMDFLPDECPVIDPGKSLDEINVMDIAGGSKLHMVSEDTKVLNVAHVMLVKGIATVGVERDGELVGVIRRGDLVAHYFGQMRCEEP